MRRLFATLALLATLVFGVSSSAAAATYYVATAGGGGSDAANGAIGTPWLTIAHGLSVINAGDILYLRAGSYNGKIFETDFAHTGTAWTAGNFITIAGYTGETATITNGSGGNIGRFQDGSVHHVLLDHLVFDGTSVAGGGALLYLAPNSHDIHLNVVEIKNALSDGILGYGDSHELRDLNVHNNGRLGTVDGSYKHDNGAYLSAITNSLIIGGTYWDNECVGLRVGSSNPENASGNTIKNVTAYQNGAGLGTGGTSPCDSIGAGILLADVNNTVMNSVAYGNSEGIVLYGLSGKATTGIKVYNNTLHSNQSYGINIESGLVSGAEIKNNILYGNGGSNTIGDVGASTVYATNMTSDPSFVSASTHVYTLLATSLAIDTGTTIALVTTDFAGTSRPQGSAYDVGAYEFVPDAGGTPGTVTAVAGAHVSAYTTAGSITTAGINTTTATFIVAVITGNYVYDSTMVVSDSKGNVWIPLTVGEQDIAGYGPSSRLVYSFPTSVGSGHTFTVNSGDAVGIAVQAFTGVLAGNPVDAQSGGSALAQTVTLGTITPSQNNELIVTGVGQATYQDGTFSIGSGFTLAESAPSSGTTNYGYGLAYKIQGTLAAVAPVWNYGTDPPALAARMAAFKASSADTTAPTVVSVTSSTANGSYTTGAVIPVQVTLSEVITVAGGTPQLTLETGTSDAVLNCSSGSGTATLTCNYTVSAGDTTSDLDYKATGSFVLNGSTIKDAAGNDAVLTLVAPGAVGSLGANKAIVIDTTAPTVTNVTSTVTNATYHLGAVIPITITFAETVNVTGFPQITLETGTNDAVVNYTSGSGSATLTFTYTVAAGHTSLDLDYKATNSLVLNSGTILDGALNAATLTLATPGQAGSLGANKAIVIDTSVPLGGSGGTTNDWWLLFGRPGQD